MTQKRVIVDSDPATGVPFRDVDDGLAILLLLTSTGITLEGITINFGNVGAEKGTEVARELLGLCASDVPIFTGSASRKQLGKTNPAVEFMIEQVNSNPGKISLLALAPLTNVATAMMLDDSFAGNLAELVIMGGSIRFPFFSFVGEFNVHLDGKAASFALAQPIPKTLITMDVISHAVFREEHLNHLKEHTGSMHRYLIKAIEPWLKLNRKVFFRRKVFFPWDPVAAAYLLEPELFDKNYYQLDIQPTGLRSGRIRKLTSSEAERNHDGSFNVNIPLRETR